MADDVRTTSSQPEVPLLSPSKGFTLGGKPHERSLLDFWSWSMSDLGDNTLRGVIAEYVVAMALGEDSADLKTARTNWTPWDLTAHLPHETRIEVKSSAYVQGWHQVKSSTITFSIREARSWEPELGDLDQVPKHHADLYVFCVLGVSDLAVPADPLDLDQWAFWVVATSRLEAERAGQQSITLGSLKSLAGPDPTKFGELGRVIREVAATTSSHERQSGLREV